MDEHRAFPRFPAHWQIEIRSDSGQDHQVFLGITTDVSRGGVGIYGGDALPTRGPLSVRLGVPQNRTRIPEDTVEIPAFMVYAAPVESLHISAVRMGINFFSVTEHDKRLLEKRLQEHFERKLP